MLAICSGVADSPAIAAAGSPGIRWIMREGDQADDQQDRQRAAQSPQDDARPCRPAQFANQTFDMRGMRNGTKPFTLDRTACTLVSEPNGNA